MPTPETKTYCNLTVKEFVRTILIDFLEEKKKDVILSFPLFQRDDDAWQADIKKSFLENVKEATSVFLGTIVLKRNGCDDGREDENTGTLKFDVIDGQQRLTTLFGASEKNIYEKPFNLGEFTLCFERDFYNWLGNLNSTKPSDTFTLDNSLLDSAKFNWIIYPTYYQGNKITAEDLYQLINLNTEKLSVFNEFKARCIEQNPSYNKINWDKLRNLFLEGLMGQNNENNTGRKYYSLYRSLSLRNIFNGTSIPNLTKFKISDLEWNLRQFLAISLNSEESGKTQEPFYKNDKFKSLNQRDILRDFIKNLNLKKDANNLLKRFESLTDGVLKKDLLIYRSSLPDLNTTNDLFIFLQIYAMSYQKWLSSDSCANTFNLYYENKDTNLHELTNIISKDFFNRYIDLSSIKKLFTWFGHINNSNIEPTHQNSLKKLENSKPQLNEIWLVDWLIFYLLNSQKTNFEKILSQSWAIALKLVSANKGYDHLKESNDSVSTHDEFQEILTKLIEKFSIPNGSYDKNSLIPSYSRDVEHWVAQNSKAADDFDKLETQLLNTYGNLCLIPETLNKRITNFNIAEKSENIIKNQEFNVLPKLYLTALISVQLKNRLHQEDDKDAAIKILIFLNAFWASFLTQCTNSIFD